VRLLVFGPVPSGTASVALDVAIDRNREAEHLAAIRAMIRLVSSGA
jgi:hypothetical protein